MASAARKLQLNPVDPENLLNPVPFYKELRENDPVHWSDVVHGWFLTRHEDVMNGLRDSRLSADRGKVLEHQFQMMGLSPESIREVTDTFKRQMACKDGAAHLKPRRQTAAAFAPQVLDSWRPLIHRTLVTHLDKLRDRREADLVPELFYQMPPLVIAELLGITPEDRERLQQWGEAVTQLTSTGAAKNLMEVARQANEGQARINQFLTNLVEERRRAPGEDLISHMLRAQEQGGMTTEEVVANTSLLLAAGHLTTTDQLSNGLYELLTRPEQLALLRREPSLLKPAIEEMMRFAPPVPFVHRIAVDNIELRGRTIRKGDIVFLGLAAANHDPAAFKDAEYFDISRDPHQQKSMSFGFGPHHCLGAGLARRELEIAFSELVHRMPEMRLDAAKLPRIKCGGLLFRGFESLPVRW
ncbi:cytochrome P450 PksS [Archangium gephyra]|uniref:Cytochrome P450 PksS n=1 Tax=Archangium gephyra TaxID=48 RepID=A0AAC8Q137_9BACT|nr:cytochrome P450 [Archangium gephyra]AKI99053.1 putative cytochrome P450 hydroxylase [Archangium gephyra]REG30961.1 cytochrome P450 PksS [Archangium gephyra]